MKKQDVKRLANKPGLIAGICNYCDRWCERCAFTSRCMNYAMQEEQAGNGKAHDIQSQKFWDELSSVFKVTLELLRESAAEHVYPKDSDGSAKVALISIDRSIGAWGVLREHFPDAGDEILDMLVHLERMRKAIEKQFPKARAFQRPGFDYTPEKPDAQPA